MHLASERGAQSGFQLGAEAVYIDDERQNDDYNQNKREKDTYYFKGFHKAFLGCSLCLQGSLRMNVRSAHFTQLRRAGAWISRLLGLAPGRRSGRRHFQFLWKAGAFVR